MTLFLHITIAVAGLFFSGLAFLLPSNTKIKISLTLVAATLISGTYLVISLHANMLHACTMGLIYTAITTFGIVLARKKLAKENS